MHYLELTLPTIAENLALDEALLQQADAGESTTELLRIWKADEFFVVLGRNSKVSDEVNRPPHEAESIPIFRRVSGGASVLAGPGCMFYSLLISLETRPQLRMLDEAHRFVMSRMVSALRPLVPPIAFDGTCDLVVDGRKISGNSLRLVRNWMLYHGTILLDLDLSAVDRWLKHPPREPAYRKGRRHSQFVTNLHVPFASVAHALRMAWNATVEKHDIPRQTIDQLIVEKYSQPTWNYLR
jgi:lipoate-protein ligase A